MANHERCKAQNVEVVNQPWEVITVGNETIHPRTKGSEVGHGLMVSEPPLEEPNCVLLIDMAMGVQTATGEEKIGCLNKVEGGKEMKMPRAKRVPLVRVHPPVPERKEYLCLWSREAKPTKYLVVVHSCKANHGR